MAAELPSGLSQRLENQAFNGRELPRAGIDYVTVVLFCWTLSVCSFFIHSFPAYLSDWSSVKHVPRLPLWNLRPGREDRHWTNDLHMTKLSAAEATKGTGLGI